MYEFFAADPTFWRNFFIRYQDRIQLRLVSEYDLATKLLTAQKIIQDELPVDFIGYLDVSVSGRAYTRQLPLTQVADAQYLAILGGKQ